MFFDFITGLGCTGGRPAGVAGDSGVCVLPWGDSGVCILRSGDVTCNECTDPSFDEKEPAWLRLGAVSALEIALACLLSGSGLCPASGAGPLSSTSSARSARYLERAVWDSRVRVLGFGQIWNLLRERGVGCRA